MAKGYGFNSTSTLWAETLTLVTAMSTAACFSAIEKKRLAEIVVRMNADSLLRSVDRNRILMSFEKMFHGGIL